ncbi:hypothetical protein DFS33DRAFT_980276 [Desarmillaria ectypa]|nr:hypothetical protein DFS33DRAFT_980276 [Desarmillaria ectypa]
MMSSPQLVASYKTIGTYWLCESLPLPSTLTDSTGGCPTKLTARMSESSPYALISSNYGLRNTCEQLYNHLRSASSLDDVLGPDFDSINIQRLGPLEGRSDPFLPALVIALSYHPSITNMCLSSLSWSDFGSRVLWHSIITGFPHITSLELEAVSLGVDELCSLLRAFPKLTDLSVDEVELSGVFPAHANTQMFDVQTIRNSQNGPEISALSISVGEGTNTLGFFTQIHSPVSLRRLDNLVIDGTGGEDVVHQIATLLDIAEPSDLSIRCVDFHLARSPPLNIASVQYLEVIIPLIDEYDFKHTNDCLKWWESTFRQVPEVNSLTDICIKVDIAPRMFHSLPTGGKALSWIMFDEALSDPKFKLDKFLAVPRPLDMSDITFNPRFYDDWLKSEVLVECFERHQSLSLRWEP